jgi:restriction system protein
MANRVAQIQCANCQNLIPIDYEDLDVQQNNADDREMGPEVFYWGYVDVGCPRCFHDIAVEYTASEYPIGAPNFDETTVKGGDLIYGFGHLVLRGDEEIYDFDVEAKLYVPEQKKIITNLQLGVSDLLVAAADNSELLFKRDWREFEELVAFIFFRHGFQVTLTKPTRDGGRDIIALRSDELNIPLKYLIECKRYARHRPVGVGIVRSLYGVHQNEGANKSVIVTTSSFTADARAFAQTRNTTAVHLSLVDFQELQEWIRRTSQGLSIDSTDSWQ